MQPKGMIDGAPHQFSRPWPKWFGWLGIAILVAASPLALAAMTMPANEYKAWGVDAVDCDGPISVYLFAVPALLIYGAGAIVNGRYRRDRLNLVCAVICTLACVLIGVNTVTGIKEQALLERDAEACR